MKTSYEYRAEARRALTDNLGWAILVLLVFGAILELGGYFSFGIATLIISGALSVGMATAFVGMMRTGKLKFVDLFSAFNNNFANTLIMGLLNILYVFLWSLLFIIPGIIAEYSYSMAPYILADNPEMNGNDALSASKRLMRGKKWSLFCLHFSFIGWLLLSLLTFGILIIVYVGPYMRSAEAAFYESIKHEVSAFSPSQNDGADGGVGNGPESV